MESEKEEPTLPINILKQTSSYLNTTEAYCWSITCKRFHFLFRTHDFFLSSFLECVVRGEQDDAMNFLKKIDLTLMIKKGAVIDYSNRHFSNISAFQYILGALDTRYMWGMFLRCIREDKLLSFQKKKEIVLELLNQYQEVENKGITYTLHGITHKNEPHFGFTPLLKTLGTYVKDYRLLPQPGIYFGKEVGKAQTLVSAHVAQHYCDLDYSFSAKTTFTAERFMRRLDVHGYWGGIFKWWNSSVLGQLYGAIYGTIRADNNDAKQMFTPSPMLAKIDLDAMTTLFEVRMKDRLAIGTQLEIFLKELEQALNSQEHFSLNIK
ncbi:MAG: hypothetical protein QM652_02390 [Legionella sp.]|uniref:hypothetical protein n=1 Tax=Legionella sp. TaxID=459 RepID=UPI0039E49D8D